MRLHTFTMLIASFVFMCSLHISAQEQLTPDLSDPRGIFATGNVPENPEEAIEGKWRLVSGGQRRQGNYPVVPEGEDYLGQRHVPSFLTIDTENPYKGTIANVYAWHPVQKHLNRNDGFVRVGTYEVGFLNRNI